MKASALGTLAVLLGYAAFIWLADPGWRAAVAENLPILTGLLLLALLGRPWRLRETVRAPSAAAGVGAVAVTLAAVVLDLTVLHAFAWTLLLALWIGSFVQPHPKGSRRYLLPLAFLAFPWIMTDAHAVGWWFRLSGAWTAQQFFQLTGLAVERAGTLLLVQGLPISVDAACAGMNTLQAMLVAGLAVAALHLGPRGAAYWWCVLVLPAVAWLANTARVIMLGVTALSAGADFAKSAFHTLGGLLALCMVFAIYVGVVQRIARNPRRRNDGVAP